MFIIYETISEWNYIGVELYRSGTISEWNYIGVELYRSGTIWEWLERREGGQREQTSLRKLLRGRDGLSTCDKKSGNLTAMVRVRRVRAKSLISGSV